MEEEEEPEQDMVTSSIGISALNKIWAKRLGLGENFRFGWKFYVEAILGSGEKNVFGWKFLVWVKILGLAEKFWFR